MVRSLLLLLSLSLLRHGRTSPTSDPPQVPLSSASQKPESSLWDPPSPNSTDHLVFASVSSLLHTWHNARYRNGHTIVPGTIPKGTLLHHGTSRKETPTTPEWTALDPEFSYMFCRTAARTETQHDGWVNRGNVPGGGGCWHLTLRTTRPLNILYFDGSAAAKVYGALDAQDLIVFGDDFAYDGTDRDSPSRVFDESERLRRLCEWGRKYELDAFVRMQSSFEVMLCDFTAGTEEVSFLNLVSELEEASNLEEGGWGEKDGPEKPDQSTLVMVYGAIDAGLRHGSSSPYSSSETRVHLDLTRLISFYDTDLFPSLVEGRSRDPSNHSILHYKLLGKTQFQQALLVTQQTRGTWRVGPLGGMSRADRDRLLERLDAVLAVDRANEITGDDVDWASRYRQVKDRYAERLEVLHYILSSSTNDIASLRKTLLNTQIYVEGLLTPYILYGVRPPSASPGPGHLSHEWATPILEQCSSHFTPLSLSEGTLSENLLISGLRGTTREVCRVLVHIWALGVESNLTAERISVLSPSQLNSLHEEYTKELTALTSWLDWSTPWSRCSSTSSLQPSFPSSDGCTFEETCYLPTWPFFHNLDPAIPGLPQRRWPSKVPAPNASVPHLDGAEDGEPDTSEWLFPQPRCIRRVFPLHLP